MPHPRHTSGTAMCRVGRAGSLALLVAACVPAVGPEEARPAPTAHGAPVRSAATPPVAPVDGPFALSLDDAPPEPATTALARAPGRELAPTHAERAAWSGDGRIFTHCHPLPGRECSECRLLHRDGTAESLASGTGCGEEPPAPVVSLADLDARLAALAPAPAPARWPAGADVVLVVETRQAEETNAGRPRAMLKLGARRREGGPAAWLLHIDPCEGCGLDQACAAQAHFDAIVPSPDGAQLAVLVHALATDGSESHRVELLAAERVTRAARTPASTPAP
jgi:hypothetical protein